VRALPSPIGSADLFLVQCCNVLAERDPTKVVRLALENAVSVAGVLLLTGAT
jgi:hypothetical protein